LVTRKLTKVHENLKACSATNIHIHERRLWRSPFIIHSSFPALEKSIVFPSF
jgi:hypothetical protein